MRNQTMSRLFFALDITDTDKQKLANWRNQQLNLPFKAVASDNFHITLAFLGAVTKEQQKILKDNASQYCQKITQKMKAQLKPTAETIQSNTLSFDLCELFKKPKVIFLGITNSPQWLNLLAEQLSSCARNIGLFQENRPYCPHISLYRKANRVPLKPLMQNITIEIKSFSLYESISTQSGACYKPIKTWVLTKKH